MHMRRGPQTALGPGWEHQGRRKDALEPAGRRHAARHAPKIAGPAASRRPSRQRPDACSACLPLPRRRLQLTDDLKNFLTTNLPKVKKDGKAKFKLGVAEAKLGSAIQVRTQPQQCLAAVQ